ncbi:MAG: hypothetical protein IPL35_02775 [Sphingobacteriales bacterium]|nr:hypothetical protein [Sphingobacteriales bacterium]
MTNVYLVSKTYIDKASIVAAIEALGEQYTYRIEKEKKYLLGLDDIDLYRDISDDEIYFIGFWVIDENEFYEDPYNINGEKYYIAIYMTHHSDILHEVNQLIRDLLAIYPDMLVTEDYAREFYSLSDILSGNIPPWLKEGFEDVV